MTASKPPVDLRAMLAESRKRRGVRRAPRHPAEVTSDRLGDAYERWYHKLSGAERDAISIVRNALERIAEGSDR